MQVTQMSARKFFAIHKKTDGLCAYCGCELESAETNNHPRQYTVDHLHPTSKGGSNGVENLIPSCRVCNVTKGNRELEVFRLNMTWKRVGCEPLTERQVDYLRACDVDVDAILPPAYVFHFETIGASV